MINQVQHKIKIDLKYFTWVLDCSDRFSWIVMLEVEVVLRQDAFIVAVEDDEAEAGSGWDFCLCNKTNYIINKYV